MATSLEQYEKVIKQAVELITDRPVLYSSERSAQPGIPYVVINPLSTTLNNLPYKQYVNQPEPSIDLFEQIVRSVEITSGVTMVGGNARGELSLLIANFDQENVRDFLYQEGLGLLRDSGVRDITDVIGGEAEQRAQADIVFHGYILPEPTEQYSIQKVQISAEIRDVKNDLIDEKTIIIGG